MQCQCQESDADLPHVCAMNERREEPGGGKVRKCKPKKEWMISREEPQAVMQSMPEVQRTTSLSSLKINKKNIKWIMMLLPNVNDLTTKMTEMPHFERENAESPGRSSGFAAHLIDECQDLGYCLIEIGGNLLVEA